MKNKKIIIITSIVLVIVLIIIGIVVFNKKGNNTSDSTTKKEEKKIITDINYLMQIKDINNSQYKSKKESNVKIASKYNVSNNIYKLKDAVQFNKKTGEMIYVRDDSNQLNVLQLKYNIDESKSVSIQLEEIMREFTMECETYMGAFNQEPESKTLYEKTEEDDEIPLEESIFLRNKLYSETYLVKDPLPENVKGLNTENSKAEKYDLNFYRDGQDLVCEFVKIID